jgi:hypothetical protein
MRGLLIIGADEVKPATGAEAAPSYPAFTLADLVEKKVSSTAVYSNYPASTSHGQCTWTWSITAVDMGVSAAPSVDYEISTNVVITRH